MSIAASPKLGQKMNKKKSSVRSETEQLLYKEELQIINFDKKYKNRVTWTLN